MVATGPSQLSPARAGAWLPAALPLIGLGLLSPWLAQRPAPLPPYRAEAPAARIHCGDTLWLRLRPQRRVPGPVALCAYTGRAGAAPLRAPAWERAEHSAGGAFFLRGPATGLLGAAGTWDVWLVVQPAPRPCGAAPGPGADGQVLRVRVEVE